MWRPRDHIPGWAERARAVGGGGRPPSGSWVVGRGSAGVSDGYGHVRRRRGDFLGFRGGSLYIEVEGARKLQMRCGLRPRDRDQML